MQNIQNNEQLTLFLNELQSDLHVLRAVSQSLFLMLIRSNPNGDLLNHTKAEVLATAARSIDDAKMLDFYRFRLERYFAELERALPSTQPTNTHEPHH